MKQKTLLQSALAIGLAVACASAQAAAMTVDSLDGPVTQNEIQSFVDFAQGLQAGASNVGNEWAQGHSGENLKAMALVYDIAPRQALLDKMVSFCDALLSERNDILPAPAGQRVIWTGRVDPVWPNQPDVSPIQTGGEQGDPVGHLGNCARQILKTTAVYNQKVAGGDPFRFGATYLLRAKTYLSEADKTVDQHILKSLVKLSDGNRMYFAANAPYKGGLPVPWNQQMMFDYGFLNLAQAHELLKDDPARVKRYDQIVQANLDWFLQSGLTRYTDKAGRPAYDWGYTMPDTSGEDNSHGSLDTAGLYRLYHSGRYGLQAAQLVPIANTVLDVMRLGDRHYAGRLNGTTGAGNSKDTNYLRSGYMLTAPFQAAAYYTMMSDAGIQDGSATSRIDAYSRFLEVKSVRAAASANKPGQR
ncbi:hypothetical protein [Chromobacterium sphagni]|uniref:Alginate lyase domain-containing protein n=1 Tax=Chromobacterium sphagni TaxID=1903179 RepID=A0ABX3CC45_9NEIS|nr:hypothetical protein [Chromobacterium sphagni]OHX19776.1 hypothetical protein BI344_16760 [Chromobacterium sphagni]